MLSFETKKPYYINKMIGIYINKMIGIDTNEK